MQYISRKHKNKVTGGTPINEFKTYSEIAERRIGSSYPSVDSVLNPVGCSLLHEPLHTAVIAPKQKTLSEEGELLI